MTSPLGALTRKPDRATDRAALDELLDEAKVGTLSTVVDGLPWSVPMLFARDGNAILLHGSTGAGALRHVAAGAPVTFTVFAMDGLVIADTLFDHSANYRSAVVRGTLELVDDARSALEVLSDKLIPGRVTEVRETTRKELAATVVLRLPIVDGQWIAKARAGGPGIESSDWTGVVPMRTVYDEPITYSGATPPDSVLALTGRLTGP
ncbi:pyridoxamine 5'-phosphate oxidase family protein [Gordonia amicalis]|uniref:Pyridoxamine 5'-phosphate oxidase family protein n=1 Tax=Gordonia amicalis TaxID=89053 RepID=A0AAE4R9K5_9ACTN|nr:pyridoxamine 5'-phosphate oxidase family protein [Gordonia amicalis]MCZ0910919.1 pyridoxamine 5'-phosphate oxidase family protein [Gordonia amicalis]MCZ4653515.1 pyridoxamine 5'-phosphate oxidase family protein [Gordonia amicalis]MDJ0454832.1 pyridoxamine 5'-phosphate oxidase family protein [Gordonia amicalis]MDV6309213.1 pyridoxamine 5'-phosphate oxidase family protein [Gordonia amicalis]MDV6314113.1 pyridoxamine 5'-phosphate oxidase family protein [Gordonia amicalis]